MTEGIVFKLKIGFGSSVLIIFIGLILQKPTGFVQFLFDRGKKYKRDASA